MRIFSNIKISESLFIAIVPIFGYIAAFFYQAGRFYVLRVPIDYIQISIELILLSAIITFSLILIVIVLVFIINRLTDKIPNKNNNSKYILNGSPVSKKGSLLESVMATFLIPVVFGILMFFLTASSMLSIIAVSTGLFILLFGLLFLPPLTHYPYEKDYRVKFERYQEYQYKNRVKMAKIEMEKKNNVVSLFGIKEEDPLYSYIKLIIFLIIWSLCAYIIGTMSINDPVHPITKIRDEEYIVVGTYSNKFILVGIDREKKVTTSEILLKNNEGDIKITRENIGIINEDLKSKSHLSL